MNKIQKEKIVSIKGTPNELIIHLKEQYPFEEVKNALQSTLENAKDFFRDVEVSIKLEGKRLSNLEYSQVVDIIINKAPLKCEKITANFKEQRLDMQNSNVQEVEFFHGTLRSGQCIQSDRNIVILGDINPSAEVIAAGNVVVLGSLKGMAWSGYPNREDTFIAAYHMNPLMLKIGQVIGRSSHKEYLKNKDNEPKIAWLSEGCINVEPLDYRAINEIVACAAKKNTVSVNEQKK